MLLGNYAGFVKPIAGFPRFIAGTIILSRHIGAYDLPTTERLGRFNDLIFILSQRQRSVSAGYGQVKFVKEPAGCLGGG
jgi:hypothetical protein